MTILLAVLMLPWIAAPGPGGGSERFDTAVLTPSAQEAYRAMLTIERAAGIGYGVVGMSDLDAPLYVLWDDPQADAALRALLVEGSPAGRYLAHCGLLALPRGKNVAWLQALDEDRELVQVLPGGCSVYELPVEEAVERFAQDMSRDLRRHWKGTWPVRRTEPHPGYEELLTPAGRQAMEIVRAATYVDGSYWLPPRDAVGPMCALQVLLHEEHAYDAFLDLIAGASAAERFHGAVGLALICPEATANVLGLLEADRADVRLDIEGHLYTIPVADAAQQLLGPGARWVNEFRMERETSLIRLPGMARKRKEEDSRGMSYFERERLSASEREAYATLARAEAVQLGDWDTLSPATRALLTLWDAEDAAGAFELLSATASPAGRLLAVCGLQPLAPERARRAELALRKSDLTVGALASEPIHDTSLELALATLVTDGTLPRRLRSEWRHARDGAAQDDERRDLTWVGSRLPETLTPRSTLESPFRLEQGGFGAGLTRSGELLLVGASAYVDPRQRGALYVLRPQGREWEPEHTLLPTDPCLNFGETMAASESILVVVRGGGTYGSRQRVNSAVEIHERGNDAWTRRATFEDDEGWITDVALSGSTAVVVGSKRVFVVERGADGWERRDLELPDVELFHRAEASEGRIAVGHWSGVSVFELVGDAWKLTATLSEGQSGPLGPVASLALQGERLLVGGHHAPRSRGEGSVTAFERRDGRWVAVQTLHGSDALPGDGFGDRLALDGERLVVLSRRGPARLFELEQGQWRERARLIEGVDALSDPVRYASFSRTTCDLSGDLLLLGMPHWKQGKGRVLVYDVAAALARARR